jgi:hypothetical protein
VDGQPVGGQPGGEVLQQAAGEGQLLVDLVAFAQRTAHERPAALAHLAVDDLAQDRLVELDHRHAGGQQVVDLLTKDAYDVTSQVVALVVGAVGDALHPHRPAQQVGPGQAHLYRLVGQPAGELRLVHRERSSSPDRPEDGGVADVAGGNVQRPELTFELLGVIDVG